MSKTKEWVCREQDRLTLMDAPDDIDSDYENFVQQCCPDIKCQEAVVPVGGKSTCPKCSYANPVLINGAVHKCNQCGMLYPVQKIIGEGMRKKAIKKMGFREWLIRKLGGVPAPKKRPGTVEVKPYVREKAKNGDSNISH